MSNRSLIHSTAWYTLGNLFVRLLNFLLLPIYSNLISPDQFGKYSLLISFSVILSALYQLGFPSGLSTFYIEEKNDASKKVIFSTSINILVINSIVLSIIIFLFARIISGLLLGDEGYYNLIQLIFISLIIETVSTQIFQLLKTKEESKKTVVYFAVGTIINFLLNLLLIIEFKLGIYGIILAQVISSILVFAILTPSVKADYKFLIDSHIAKKLFIFCFPIFIAGIFHYGIDVIDRFLLNNYFNQEVVGVYSFSYRIAMVMNLFVISFRTAWIPHSLNLYHSKKYSESFGKSFSNLVAVSLALLIFGTLFSDDLFNVKIGGKYFFDPAYADGLVIIPFVLVGYLFNGIGSFFFVYPLTENRSVHFVYADGLGLLINISSNILLIPHLGMIGAAIATSISYIASASYLYLVSRKFLIVNYQKKQLVKLILITISVLATGIVLKQIYADIILIILFTVSVSIILKINPLNIFGFPGYNKK